VYEHAAFRLAEAAALGLLAILFLKFYREEHFHEDVENIKKLSGNITDLKRRFDGIVKEGKALRNTAQSIHILSKLLYLEDTIDDLAAAGSSTSTQKDLIEKFRNSMMLNLGQIASAVANDIREFIPDREGKTQPSKDWVADDNFLEHLVTLAGHSSFFSSFLADITPSVTRTSLDQTGAISFNTSIEHYCFAVRNLLKALGKDTGNFSYEFYTVFRGDPIFWLDPSLRSSSSTTQSDIPTDPRWLVFTERTSRMAKFEGVKLRRFFLIPSGNVERRIRRTENLRILCRPVMGKTLPVIIWDFGKGDLNAHDNYSVCDGLLSSDSFRFGESPFLVTRLEELWGKGRHEGQIVPPWAVRSLLELVNCAYDNRAPLKKQQALQSNLEDCSEWLQDWPAPTYGDWPQPSYVYVHSDLIHLVEPKTVGEWKWWPIEKVLDDYHSMQDGYEGWKICDLSERHYSDIPEKLQNLRLDDVFAVKRHPIVGGKPDCEHGEWVACLGADNLDRDRNSLRLWFKTKSRLTSGSWSELGGNLTDLFETLKRAPKP
jgi:hypothetical protein